MASARWRSVVAAGFWTCLLAAGPTACSALLDGELGPVGCSDEGAYGPPACAAGQSCVGGLCVAIGAPLGAACAADDQCARGGFCLSPEAVGAAGLARCSRACCSSSECGDPGRGLVCWSGVGGAGGLCWPAAQVGVAQPGVGRAGDGCQVGGGCRSGWCDGGRCAGTCCDDSYCGGAMSVCRVRPTPLGGAPGWACSPPSSAAALGPCQSADECRTGACLDLGPNLKLCAAPCCSSRDCGGLLPSGNPAELACAPTLDGALRACSLVLPGTAQKVTGAPCTSGDECRGGVCLADEQLERYCSDSCCADASCGDPAVFACRPAAAGGVWALRCIRK